MDVYLLCGCLRKNFQRLERTQNQALLYLTILLRSRKNAETATIKITEVLPSSKKNIACYWKDGKCVYLPGAFNSPESKEAYDNEMALLLS